MLKREYSLKTRYNFSKVLKYGNTFNGKLFLIKYFKVDPKYLEKVPHKFAVITSNKLTKRKVDQNKIRRAIFFVIANNLNKFPENHYYVFIPKKKLLELLKSNDFRDQIASEILYFVNN